jgi:hypothetical protein
MTTIVTRSGKGSPLTNNEMDANLNNLNNDKQEVSTAVTKTSTTGAAQLPVGTVAQRPGSPTKGQFRYNDDTDVFEGYTEGVGWGQVGGGQMLGAAQEKAIFFNAQTITENITIAADQNGGSFGNITIADGYAVTIADGGSWTIVGGN